MPIFLTTLALFAGSIAVHVIIWKVRLPERQMRTLVVIFAAGFAAWLALSLARHAAPLTVLHVALYYWSVCFCYMITYSAIEADSPTLSLMRFVGDGARGRSAEEITRFMDERPFLGARLAALARSGLIREQGGRYVLSGSESLAFRLILGFRRLYGSIPKGG
jgi:hypothetical protein